LKLSAPVSAVTTGNEFFTCLSFVISSSYPPDRQYLSLEGRMCLLGIDIGSESFVRNVRGSKAFKYVPCPQ
jgi:hypothetical protein